MKRALAVGMVSGRLDSQRCRMEDESPDHGRGHDGRVTEPAELIELLGPCLADQARDELAELESPLQRKFAAPRDKDAWLHEPTHTYHVNGVKVKNSVTTIIKKHWPQFQADAALQNYEAWKANKSSKYGMLIQYLQVVEGRNDDYCKHAIAALWTRNGELASQLGTAMHRDFQFICEGNAPPQGETEEVCVFRKWLHPFMKRYCLEPWRAEWIIYYEHKGRVVVAGQVDLVMKHKNREEYWCIDYKRKSSAPKYPGGPRQLLGTENGGSFGGATGSGPFGGLPHNDFSVYTTQLNAYGHIAATQYGIDFRDRMCLLQIHPDLSGPNLVRVERMDETMEELFALEIAAMPEPEPPATLF